MVAILPQGYPILARLLPDFVLFLFSLAAVLRRKAEAMLPGAPKASNTHRTRSASRLSRPTALEDDLPRIQNALRSLSNFGDISRHYWRTASDWPPTVRMSRLHCAIRQEACECYHRTVSEFAATTWRRLYPSTEGVTVVDRMATTSVRASRAWTSL
jgi:hypothetical protein